MINREQLSLMSDAEVRAMELIRFNQVVVSVVQSEVEPLLSTRSNEVIIRINAELDNLDNTGNTLEDALNKARLEGIRAGMLIQQGRVNPNEVWGTGLFGHGLRGNERIREI